MDFTRNKQSFAAFLIIILQTGMACQMDNIKLEMQTPGLIPCNHNIAPGSFHLVKWTKSTNDECYKNGGQALVSWDGNLNVADPHYGIDTNYSLVINNVNLDNNGIFRCTVFSEGTIANAEIDTRISVYKQPDNPPLMNYAIQDNNVTLNCSVGSIFPLTFPEVICPDRDSNTVVMHSDLNGDGTYEVLIFISFPHDGRNNALECSYSFRNPIWTSFLYITHGPAYGKGDVHPYATTVPYSGTEQQNPTITITGSANHRAVLVGLFSISCLLNFAALVCFLLAMKWKYNTRIQLVSTEKINSNKEENAKWIPKGDREV